MKIFRAPLMCDPYGTLYFPGKFDEPQQAFGLFAERNRCEMRIVVHEGKAPGIKDHFLEDLGATQLQDFRSGHLVNVDFIENIGICLPQVDRLSPDDGIRFPDFHSRSLMIYLI